MDSGETRASLYDLRDGGGEDTKPDEGDEIGDGDGAGQDDENVIEDRESTARAEDALHAARLEETPLKRRPRWAHGRAASCPGPPPCRTPRP